MMQKNFYDNVKEQHMFHTTMTKKNFQQKPFFSEAKTKKIKKNIAVLLR